MKSSLKPFTVTTLTIALCICLVHSHSQAAYNDSRALENDDVVSNFNGHYNFVRSKPFNHSSYDVLVICEQIEESDTNSSTREWKVSIHTARRPVRALLMTGEVYSSSPEEIHPYILNFRRGSTLPIIPGGYSIEFYGEVDLAQAGISSRDEMFITVDEIHFIYARTGENVPQERVSYSNCSLTNEE